QERGLTEFGAQIIQRMNALGMAVDISHCGDRTTLDAIETSTRPALVTHSNFRALNPGSARCKPDTAIRKTAAKGAAMGITTIRYFVKQGSPVTVEHMLNHVDHVAKLVGVEHVGLGTDVDLVGRDPRNDLDSFNYSRKIFEITAGLLRRGYSRPDIELI